MIPRYSRPEMARLWSDENRFASWLEVEIAASEVLVERGVVPAEALAAIKQKARFDLARIEEIEREVQHDLIAFVSCVAENVGPEGRWLHYGLTSSDVVDTALAMLLRDACDLLRADLVDLMQAVHERALRHKHAPMIGRTHGVHAEPMTFGLKLALWYAELGRDVARLRRAREVIAVGKLSGAVGTFAHLPPSIEAEVCRVLGLQPAPVASQVIQRDRHAHYVATLAIIAATLDMIATECRHLQRTEVREAEEYFSEKQKGSSAMPHKRNPITAERVVGLARVVKANAQVGFDNVALWHERDISHSSAERVVLADSYIATDYLLSKLEWILDGLQVYPERMKANLGATKGLIYSSKVLLALVDAGMLREDAYVVVQRNAMKVWDAIQKGDAGGPTYRETLEADPDVTSRLDAAKLDELFDPWGFLARVGVVFDRVAGLEF